MNIIQLPRGGGKTHLAINWLQGAQNRHLVVTTSMQARHTREQAPTDLADRIHSINEAIQPGTLPLDAELAVDNLENLLLEVLGRRVNLVTLSSGA